MGQEGVRTITRKELSERIAEKTGHSQAAVRAMLKTLFDEVVEELSQGNRIEFRDFGVFEVRTRAPRIAHNPRSLNRVLVPERKSVKFKPGKGMRDVIERDQAPTTPISSREPMPELKPDPKNTIKPDTSGIGDELPVRQ